METLFWFTPDVGMNFWLRKKLDNRISTAQVLLPNWSLTFYFSRLQNGVKLFVSWPWIDLAYIIDLTNPESLWFGYWQLTHMHLMQTIFFMNRSFLRKTYLTTRFNVVELFLRPTFNALMLFFEKYRILVTTMIIHLVI